MRSWDRQYQPPTPPGDLETQVHGHCPDLGLEHSWGHSLGCDSPPGDSGSAPLYRWGQDGEGTFPGHTGFEAELEIGEPASWRAESSLLASPLRRPAALGRGWQGPEAGEGPVRLPCCPQRMGREMQRPLGRPSVGRTCWGSQRRGSESWGVARRSASPEDAGSWGVCKLCPHAHPTVTSGLTVPGFPTCPGRLRAHWQGRV